MFYGLCGGGAVLAVATLARFATRVRRLEFDERLAALKRITAGSHPAGGRLGGARPRPRTALNHE